MNFQGNFKHIGTTDISLIKDLVGQLTDVHWNLKTIRQKRYEVHKDTQTIGLVYDEDFRHMNSTVLPAYELFAPAIRRTLGFIANFYEDVYRKAQTEDLPEGYFVRLSLVKLLAGGTIDEHRDMNFSLAHSHRIHIPIETNDRVFFTVGNETINMKEGEVYEINNRRDHHVKNEGSTDRVHFILDWVFPREHCCCAEKVHPGEECTPSACLDTDRLRVPCNCHPIENDPETVRLTTDA